MPEENPVVVEFASQETIKKLAAKLHFHNVLIETVDDPVLLLIFKLVLNPMAAKVPVDILPIVQEAFIVAVEAMPTIEIGGKEKPLP